MRCSVRILRRMREPPSQRLRREDRAQVGSKILATELGFEDLGSMRMGPITTLIFAKQPVRVEIDLENRGLREVRIKARSKEATLDAALAELAPALVKGLPSDDKARLDYYGAFLRTAGGPLFFPARQALGAGFRDRKTNLGDESVPPTWR